MWQQFFSLFNMFLPLQEWSCQIGSIIQKAVVLPYAEMKAERSI